MQIQWFPGHMNKARNEIKTIIPRVDLLIEVLDARIPYSSQNPMIEELRGHTPVLKLLAKADLADSDWTSKWKAWHEAKNGIRALIVSIENKSKIHALKSLIFEMLPESQREAKSATAMIAGVPNVGKSTIINILAGRKIAKTGNEPAVTKGQQRIVIGNGITLIDTPGMLWPNVRNPKSGLRLAAVGSVKDTAMEYEDVAAFVVEYMLQHHSQPLLDSFRLDTVPENAVEFLEQSGRIRNCIGRSNVVDYERISRIVVNEFRSGKYGQVTLEHPSEIEKEIVELEKVLAENEAKKQERKSKRKQAFKARNAAQKTSRRKSRRN